MVQEPLAAQLRPERLEDFFGQEHLLAPGKPLWRVIKEKKLHSMILWGPPGTGKTTLAHLLSSTVDAQFLTLSAVMAGLKEIREAISMAEQAALAFRQHTVLFIDEVHRFNKTQQDSFLPFVENGTITFIGATTENPAFELNNALLSRVRVYSLHSLTQAHLLKIIDRALIDKDKGFGANPIDFDLKYRQMLAQIADGDARRALNILTQLMMHAAQDNLKAINEEVFQQVLIAEPRRFDKQGDTFYDQISALHKSVRGSSPDAALYWFARMLDAGCDPLYIARRVVRMATEDIGNADPRALQLALNAWDTQERLGSPEGELAVAQAITYLAVAPKSNAVYLAYQAATKEVQMHGSLPVPAHLRNAPTHLAKALGHGQTYRYDHNEPSAFSVGQTYFPDSLGERRYYEPVPRGLEIKISEKLKSLREACDLSIKSDIIG